MIGGIIGSVFAHRDAVASRLGFSVEHRLRCTALGGAVGGRDHAGHRQPMPVLHGGVAHIAELRVPAGGLAVKPAVGIGRARMRVILAQLAVEVTPSSSSPLPFLGRKLFCEAQASISVPATEKCSPDNCDLSCGWFRSVVMNLANISLFGRRSRFLVHARVPHWVVWRKSYEPAVQKIVIQSPHQLAFRPDAIEHLQQQRVQQLLRRDRRTPFAGVELAQAAVQLAQHIAHKFPNSSSAVEN